MTGWGREFKFNLEKIIRRKASHYSEEASFRQQNPEAQKRRFNSGDLMRFSAGGCYFRKDTNPGFRILYILLFVNRPEFNVFFNPWMQTSSLNSR